MKQILLILTILLGSLFTSLQVAGQEPISMNAYFAPKAGFASYNNTRTIPLADNRIVPATLENAVLDLLLRANSSTRIRMAIYSFSTKHIQDALIEAALRGADIKIILDEVNDFSEKSRIEFCKKIQDKSAAMQLKVVKRDRMKELNRTYIHRDTTEFVGSMHEKFGVFQEPGKADRMFIGSANISYSSDSIFAENRIVIEGDSGLAAALLQEFDTLWKTYGSCALGNCTDDLPVSASPEGSVKLITNVTPGAERTSMIQTVINLLAQAEKPNGALDIAMFYFTQRQIADTLLNMAQKNPSVTIRLLLDQGQIDTEEDQESLGFWLDQQIVEKKLSNFSIRYRWQPQAYGWDKEKTPPRPAKIFFNSALMHHKFFIINGNTLVNGSFNWTDLGEVNIENILVVPGATDTSREVVQRFAAEFQELWSSQSKSGDEARVAKREIYEKIQLEQQTKAQSNQ